MSDYKVVNAEQLDADLTIVADAIRSKGGTTEQLSFPYGMKQAVEAIQSCGGSSEEFVGIKYSNFDENGLPRVVDASNLQEPSFSNTKVNMFYRFFQNVNGGLGNGFYTDMEEVYLPNWLTMFAQEMFANCVSLKKIYGDFSNVLSLGGNAFQNCKALEQAPKFLALKANLSGSSFNGCTSLKSFNFYKVPVGVNSLFFNNCTNLTDIYVPWSEGEVANAPWGATNATIHYNTTYDENHNPIV